MVVAPQVPAVETGVDVLRNGGNAIDAAVTAAFVQMVVDPQNCGIGGFGAATVRTASGEELPLPDLGEADVVGVEFSPSESKLLLRAASDTSPLDLWVVDLAGVDRTPRQLTRSLGPQIERGVGTWPFVTLFLASAGVGGAFAFYFGDLSDIAVGASGAIFGLFGIWLSWALHRRNTMQGRALLTQLIFLLAINAAIAFVFPRISWQAHLGGLIAGFVIGEIWARIRGPNADAMRAWVGLAVAVLAALWVAI